MNTVCFIFLFSLVVCFAVRVEEREKEDIKFYRYIMVSRFLKNKKYYAERVQDIFYWNRRKNNFFGLNDVYTYSIPEFDKKDFANQTFYIYFDEARNYPYFLYNPKNRTLAGISGDIWNILESHLKFRTRIGSVHNFDFCLTPLGKKHRLVLYPIARKASYLFVRYPRTYDDHIFFLKAFPLDFWCVTLSILGLLTLALWLTIIFSTVNTDASFSLCLLTLIGGICGQGSQLPILGVSSKILLIVSYVFGIFILVALTADIKAHMNQPVQSLDDLLKQEKISICYSYLEENVDFLVEEGFIMNKTLDGPQCTRYHYIDELLDTICKDNTMVLEQLDNMYYVQDYNDRIHKCTFMQLPNAYGEEELSIQMNIVLFVNKRSFDNLLLKLESFGIIKYIQKRYSLSRISFKTVDLLKIGSIKSISFLNCVELFIYLFVGYGIGILLSFIEILYARYKNKKFKLEIFSGPCLVKLRTK